MINIDGFLSKILRAASNAACPPAKPGTPSQVGLLTKESKESSSTAQRPEVTGSSNANAELKAAHGTPPRTNKIVG